MDNLLTVEQRQIFDGVDSRVEQNFWCEIEEFAELSDMQIEIDCAKDGSCCRIFSEGNEICIIASHKIELVILEAKLDRLKDFYSNLLPAEYYPTLRSLCRLYVKKHNCPSSVQSKFWRSANTELASKRTRRKGFCTIL